MDMIGQLLDRRYRVVQILSSGAFAQTYLAADTRRPGHPQCVVKQLRHLNNNSAVIKTAHRLFKQEAEILEKLGKHNQIPFLLAYFEEGNHFYLVEEYVPGSPLNKELLPGVPWMEERVIAMLEDILDILVFVHDNGVIHRDVNPSNLIRRQADNKLVLIDFGSVKEVNNKIAASQGSIPRTIATGTPSYMPMEQFQGNPQFNSDIYAVGMIAVQALTGLPAGELPKLQSNNQSDSGKIVWRNRAQCSPNLGNIIDKMIHTHFSKRYQSALDVLTALKKLDYSQDSNSSSAAKNSSGFSFSLFRPRFLIPLILIGLVSGGIGLLIYNNPFHFFPKPDNSTRGSEKIRRGDSQGKIADLNRVLDLHPDSADAFYRRGNAYFDTKQYDKAIGDYTSAIRLDPKLIDAYFNRGLARYQFNDKPGAIDDFSQLISLSLSDTEGYYQRGITYFDLQRYAEAIKDYTEVIRLDAKSAKAYHARGLARASSGDIQGAIADYSEALKIEPKYHLALYSRGMARFNSGDYRGAIIDYSDAIKLNPQNGDAFVNRCSAQLNLGEYQAAINDCTQAILINAKDSSAYNNRGIAYLKLGDKEKAMLDCNKAIEINPQNASAYTNRGLIHTVMGDQRSAIGDFSAAIGLNPGDIQAYSNRAKAYHQLKDYNNAISDYIQAIRLNPNFAVAYYGRGLVRRDLGDKKGAISDLQKAGKLYLEQNRQGNYKEVQSQIEQIK
jgi:tetratricopeptide (TPR) repeat protein